MRTKPTSDEPDDMPAEFDFSNAVHGRYAGSRQGETRVRIHNADGTVEELVLQHFSRPDEDAFSPDSITGVLADVLYYVYNPATDVLPLRLVPSLSDSVLFGEDEDGFHTVTSEVTGKAVGLVVRDYGKRFLGGWRAGEALSRGVLEQDLGLVREGMRLAA